MADHVRQQLREAVTTALTSLTTTGSNVFASRLYRMQDDECPGLRIYTKDEQARTETIHPNALRSRDVEVVVEGVARGVADLDDTLDDIQKEVEIALAAGVTVGSKTVPLDYTGCSIEDDDESDVPTGVARMTFRAVLFTIANAPDVAV
jgi:hypothetical protein